MWPVIAKGHKRAGVWSRGGPQWVRPSYQRDAGLHQDQLFSSSSPGPQGQRTFLLKVTVSPV